MDVSDLIIQPQPNHALTDYDLAERARLRNEPRFVPDASLVTNNPATFNTQGRWESIVTWPFAFASAASLPDGRILAWGGNNINSFTGGVNTYAAVWNPATSQFLDVNVSNHSMFCAAPVMLEDGTVFSNGGDGTRERTSAFDFRTNQWTRLQNMSTGRWYPGSVALPDGRVFTMLGEPGGRYPEIWSPAQGWSLLTGADLQGRALGFTEYQANWLPYVFLAPNGRVFHAGPTRLMNYIDTAGSGSISAVGNGAMWYPKYSTHIMYDVGKILIAGGANQRDGTSAPSTNQAMTIDLNGAMPITRVVAPMAFARKFNASVMLPNGEVMVIGGNTSGIEFSDNGTVLAGEIWNPATETWRTAASMSVPRNYHSVALLMTDGRVWSGGGGLCACNADHPNSQIYTPPYLFNADGSLATRPVINSAPDIVTHGRTFTVQASDNAQSFSMIKLSSTTHNLNSDLRFLRVPFTKTGTGTFQLTLNSNANILTPGYWMLFALDDKGVPSVSKVMQVASSAGPRIVNPGNQNSLLGASVLLTVTASTPLGNALTYSAAGLPPGLSINPTTGVIAGTTTAAGIFPVTLSVSDGTASAPASLNWTVSQPAQAGQFRYVRFVGLSEINNNPWASAAEFNVLDGAGNPINRTGWSVTTDSQETQGEDGRASNILDGNPATIWHTQWSTSNPPYPHWVVIDMGAAYSVGGFRYLPRSDNTNGTIASYQFFVSADGQNWGSPVAQGTFAANLQEKVVTFALSQNAPPLLAPVPSQASALNSSVSLAMSASDANGDTLTFSAAGLPPGLSINPATGLIFGSPTALGTYNVTVTVSDGKGGVASQGFVWVIQPAQQALTLAPLSSAPQPVNSQISYSASASNGINPRFKWFFGDGTPETAYSTSPAVNHTFAQPGLYLVRVTVTDDTGVEQSSTIMQAVYLPQTAGRASQSSTIAFEARATGNSRVWVVNQDNDTVSVFDAVTNAKLAEFITGSMPRSIALSNGRAWVTNKGASTITVIDTNALALAQTLVVPFGSQPHGIAFAPNGGPAFVALEGLGRLLKMDPATGAVLGSIDLGQNIRGVAVAGDGATVLVSRFITPRLPGEETAVVQTGPAAGAEVLAVSAGSMTLVRTVILQHSDKADTEVQGRGIPNYLGAPVFSPDGRSAWVPSKQDNIRRGTLRDGNTLNFQNAMRAITSRIDLSAGISAATEDLAGRIDHDNSGLGSAAIFDPSGNYLFVALESSREVAVADAYSLREIFRIQTGRAPAGLAVSADGRRLFVNNFMDRSIGVYDLAPLLNRGERTVPLLATLGAIASERLSPQVLSGKQMFYDAKDPRLAREGYVSCAACHNDGGQDGRVWDFTGFGEGLRNTIALRGRAGAMGFLHWSGNFNEVHDFEGQIRNFAGGTGLMTDAQFSTGTRREPLGDPKAGVSADLDALAAYLTSLNTFAPSPFRNADGTMTSEGQAGRAVFASANCAQCHGGTAFSSSGANTLFNIGTLKPGSGSRLNGPLAGIDPPTLRDVWATAPYLHDGSAATLSAAVSAHNNVSLNTTQLQQLVAYLQQVGNQETTAPIPNAPPAVSLASPANNAQFNAPASITINANATDSDGTISRVEFFNGTTSLGVDTAAPYAFAWSNVPAGTYAISARATDNAGATVQSAAATVIVNTGPRPTGQILREVWTGISGTAVSNLTGNTRYPSQPNSTAMLTSFEAPTNWADNYGTRIRGFLYPQVTGQYRFWIASDDSSQLRLSTDDNPANAAVIAQVNGWTSPRQWTKYSSQRSVLITLQAGRRYYIEALQKEGGGGDNLAVSWQIPGGAQAIIAGQFLSP